MGLSENKFGRLSGTRLAEQKPFRGFDITSLIRKDDDSKPNRLESKSPAISPSSSPNISVGPPQSPPTNPYTNLFNSGLYQQYLGQLLANSGSAPPLNPMLLQAQLAMAAQNNMQNNHAQLLANYNNHASMISERLKQNNRFSPYPVSSISSSVPSTLGSPTGMASAFKALGTKMNHPSSPPVSPPHSMTPPNLAVSPNSMKSEPPTSSSSPPRSDIKNIENMINGLNGTSEGRFGLSHDSRIS